MLRNVIRKVELLKPLQFTSHSCYSSQDRNKRWGPLFPNNETFEPIEETEEFIEHPMTRAWKCLKRDFVMTRRQIEELRTGIRQEFEPDDYSAYSPHLFPNHTDVVIIGGGAIGLATAYFLKQRVPKDFEITVIEKDPTYKTASSALSVGGLRQQFSFEENIQMSLYGADFFRNAHVFLHIAGEPRVDVGFRPNGYLFMATEKSAHVLESNSKLQNSLGARNVLLTPDKLKTIFPWVNTDGIALACLGIEKEGWFDPWAYLTALRKKCISLGVRYVKGEVKGLTFKDGSDVMDSETGKAVIQLPEKVVVQLSTGEKRTMAYGIMVIAAGAQSQRIARMVGIGTGEGVMSIPLPVEPRKRYVYCFHCKDGPGLNTPLTIDPSGAYFRREGLGGLYVCGQAPDVDEEPPINNLNVDESFFHEKVWPNLANRVPAFEKIKLKSSWAGFYEYNYYDANGIIGPHPYYANILFATGFSGHGIQQSPAVGRAIMELIVDSGYESIDLRRMSFDRFLTLEPMEEACIV